MEDQNVNHGYDDYFGVCPICHKNDGYANAGQTHVFFCKEHKERWIAGADIFSDWRYQTEEEQRRIWNEIGLDHFERIYEAPRPAPETDKPVDTAPNTFDWDDEGPPF
jgi:hypothetical protein